MALDLIVEMVAGQDIGGNVVPDLLG